MGSLFTTTSDSKIKTPFSKAKLVPFYLQFVPGYVVDVSTNELSRPSGDTNHINSIIALPHIHERMRVFRKDAGEDQRYYPLLRGIFEVPAKGDPVLLCTIGGIQYYLGPLNTQNQVNWNDDNLYAPEPSVTLSEEGNPRNEGYNFIKENFNRFSKPWISKLDGENGYMDNHGDIMLEGRHGNSIRVGSRKVNPYIFMSNARSSNSNLHESLYDGSLISITNTGTLKDHFGQISVRPPRPENFKLVDSETGEPTEVEETSITVDFKLGSDFTIFDEEPSERPIEKLVSSVNGDQDGSELIYDYEHNQILFSSERIILNAKEDEIYISSKKDIHIGAKRHLTISTNKDLIIESQKTYLGNPKKEENDGNMEPMVFGNLLLEVLQEILAALKGAQGLCTGAPIPLVDSTMLPLSTKVTQIEQKLNSILSNKHFVEPN